MFSKQPGVINQKYNIRQYEIFSDVQISPYINEKTSRRPKVFKALWDTGADMTCITRKVVEQFNLQAIHELPVLTAGGERMSKIYAVNIILPGGIKKLIRAVECDMSDDVEVLIGMDIITQGDFAISSDNSENMYFSYRHPSKGPIIFE